MRDKWCSFETELTENLTGCYKTLSHISETRCMLKCPALNSATIIIVSYLQHQFPVKNGNSKFSYIPSFHKLLFNNHLLANFWKICFMVIPITRLSNLRNYSFKTKGRDRSAVGWCAGVYTALFHSHCSLHYTSQSASTLQATYTQTAYGLLSAWSHWGAITDSASCSQTWQLSVDDHFTSWAAASSTTLILHSR